MRQSSRTLLIMSPIRKRFHFISLHVNNLTEHSAAEIRGDWSNLKGTEYHLVYALWALLRGGTSDVAFYKGNDLLERARVPPPVLLGEDASLPTVMLEVNSPNDANTDIWVQLKATSDAWTPGALLADNLLENFIYNAAQSQRQNRLWRVRLIAQGEVRRTEVQEFVADPESKPILNGNLERIITAAQANLIAAGYDECVTKIEAVRALALDLLTQLALTTPIHIETLKAEIETELAYAYLDPGAVKRVGDALIGAMMLDASAGPSAARAYDLAWIDETVGEPVVRRGRLDADPVAACDDAVRRVVPPNWDASHFAPRPDLARALEKFSTARETLFVLLGTSGSGKSWAMAEWSTNGLAGRVRLLVPGSDIDHQRTLSALVAGRLQSQTTVAWTPEQFLQRLRGAAFAASAPTNGTPRGAQMFVILEDLRVPAAGTDVLRRDLARLVDQSREAGVKLVLTCQTQLWNIHRLFAEIDVGEIFAPDEEPGTQRKPYSFLIGDYTADEQLEALKMRFGSERGSRVASRLRASSFTPLNNPYLLARYLEQHGDALARGDARLPAVTVDGLLDARVRNALERSATALDVSVEELQSGFNEVVGELWRARPQGLTRAQAVGWLTPHLAGQSEAALRSLRHQGLLTPDAEIQLAEQRIADRLFAVKLGSLFRRAGDAAPVVDELRLDDVGVIAAFLRGVADDPVAWSELLLQRDEKWSIAITNGLSQCDPDDYRVLAFMLSLSRSERAGDADPEHALGQLAARSEQAWRWVIRDYLSDEDDLKRRGARLIAPAMEFVPHKVEAAVRRRLSRVRLVNDSSIFDREKKQQRIIKGSLDALRLINHRGAADSARRIIRRYSHLIDSERTRGGERANYEFEEDLDYARGRVALFGAAGEVENIACELTNEDDLTRYRAAWAVLPITRDRPELVASALCRAIQVETHHATLNRLMVSAYHLIRTHPDELLAALAETSVLRWDEQSFCAGQALVLLGNLANDRPRDVQRLLPSLPLTAYSQEAQAMLSEILAYAWWRCGEHTTDAIPHLTSLAEPDLSNIEEEFSTFALRGAATARLALISIGRCSAAELTGRQIFYPYWSRRFLYVDLSDFVERHAPSILDNAGYESFKESLLRCLSEHDRVPIYPLDQRMLQSRFVCAVRSLDVLIELARAMPEPLPLLNALPSDWQQARAASRLLEAGRTDPPVIDFARRASIEPTGTTSLNASAERDVLRARLAHLEPNPRQALEQQRDNTGHPFLPNSGQVHALAQLGDANPDQLLALLDDTVLTCDDLSTLYSLESEVSSWQGILIARVYRRMFDMREINVREARELCRQMLDGLQRLSPSGYYRDYHNLYSAIARALDGELPDEVVLSAPESVIRRSHDLASSILQTLREAATNEGQPDEMSRTQIGEGNRVPQASGVSPAVDPHTLSRLLSDRRGWMDTERYKLENGTLSSGSGLYMIYFFPALRLALIALHRGASRPDAAARFMRESAETHKVIQMYNYVTEDTRHPDDSAREDALTTFDERLRCIDLNDERLLYWRGFVLLLMRRLPEAEAALQDCIAAPSCDERLRASALYNLACVHACGRRPEECREALQASHRLHPIDKAHAASDPDFENVRGEDWFQAFVTGTD